jgi:uncharacterized lipoprotein YajG
MVKNGLMFVMVLPKEVDLYFQEIITDQLVSTYFRLGPPSAMTVWAKPIY